MNSNPKRSRRELQRRRDQPLTTLVGDKLTASPAQRRRMQESYLGVLYAIERSICDAFLQSADIDDPTVAAVLRHALRNTQPETPAERRLLEQLKNARSNCDPYPDDEIWTLGLRVVYGSVETHSNKQRGATSYLSYIHTFLNPSKRCIVYVVD